MQSPSPRDSVEREQNIQPQNMPFWQIDCFELKSIEKQQIWEGSLPLPYTVKADESKCFLFIWRQMKTLQLKKVIREPLEKARERQQKAAGGAAQKVKTEKVELQ